MRLARLIILASVMLLAHGARAANLTDLWWNPAESGWGANIVQQDDTAVVTLFVYGADGEPTWLFGVASIYAEGPGGLPYFRGSVYRTRGSYYGVPFDPAKHQSNIAGPLWLTPAGANALGIEYVADGIAVKKDVVRQTWRQSQPAAWYLSSFTLRQSTPDGPPYGTLQYQADMLLLFDSGNAVIKVDRPEGSCLYRGALQQSGRYASVSGTFECGVGDAGSFELSGLEFSEHGVAGHLRTTRPDRVEYGRFGGPRY